MANTRGQHVHSPTAGRGSPLHLRKPVGSVYWASGPDGSQGCCGFPGSGLQLPVGIAERLCATSKGVPLFVCHKLRLGTNAIGRLVEH